MFFVSLCLPLSVSHLQPKQEEWNRGNVQRLSLTLHFYCFFFSPFTALAFWQNKAQNAKHKFGNSFLFLEKKNIQKRETNRKKRRENTQIGVFPPKTRERKVKLPLLMTELILFTFLLDVDQRGCN